MNKNDSQFLAGGDMEKLISSRDWSATTVGNPETWPQSLKTAVSMCLNAPIPMSIWWGRELVMLYNDFFQQFVGAKHADLVGSAGHHIWPEGFAIPREVVRKVFESGKSISFESQSVRNTGYNDYTFSLSPVLGESGNTEGVFCMATGATSIVNSATGGGNSSEPFQAGMTNCQKEKILWNKINQTC